MSNISGDKGLYNKILSIDGDWSKNKVHIYILIIMIGYFATKLLYSIAYNLYSYESLENEVLSFGLLMILSAIIFLACNFDTRGIVGGKNGANWLFFFGLMIGINFPMIYKETYKSDPDDNMTRYLFYILLVVIILLAVGLTLVSTEKKMQYVVYSFILVTITIATIMARVNRSKDETEPFSVDIYTVGDSKQSETKLRKEDRKSVV